MQIERKSGALRRRVAACLLTIVIAVAACCLLLPPRGSAAYAEEGSAPAAGEESLELIGEINQSYHRLSWQLCVFWNEVEGRFILIGDVAWEKDVVWFWESPYAAEEVYEDKVCFYLGEETGLHVADSSASGIYYGGGEVGIELLEAPQEEGFLIGWRFHEKSGYLGKELEKATFRVELEGTIPPASRIFPANMRYIHTYSKNDPMVDFALSTGEKKGTFTGRNFFSMLSEDSWTVSSSVLLAKEA